MPSLTNISIPQLFKRTLTLKECNAGCADSVDNQMVWSYYLEMLEKFFRVEGDVSAALAPVDLISMSADVLLELLFIVGLVVTLWTLQFGQLILGGSQTWYNPVSRSCYSVQI